jgi:hypothetical protein
LFNSKAGPFLPKEFFLKGIMNEYAVEELGGEWVVKTEGRGIIARCPDKSTATHIAEALWLKGTGLFRPRTTTGRHAPPPFKTVGFRVYYGEEEGGLARTVADCGYQRIRELNRRMTNEEFAEAEANALLFSAAPELLEVVKEALPWIPRKELEERMRAAVAKAEGQV